MTDFEYSFDESILSPKDDEVVRVVFTTPLHEGRLREFCLENDIVSYLPLKRSFRIIRRGYKSKSYEYQTVVLRPMFPSYIFLKMKPEDRSKIFRSNSVVRILGGDNVMQERLLGEIRLVRQIEEIAKEEELEFNPGIKEGGRFLIESGVWQGVYGWLKKKNKRSLWTVEIECLNSFVQATIDPTQYKMTPVRE